MTKISIIIPMYNESRYISRCLESLKKQTYSDFEVILVDDGSKDNTIKIAEGFYQEFSLRILQQTNSGPGKARNWGVREAKGDIVVLVDADMYFDKDFIRNLVDPILKGNEIGTTHGIELVGNPENIWAKTRCTNRIPNPQRRSGVYRAILKNIFLESGGFDSSRGYFDDNLSHINEGKGALTIMDAICYHNNPSTLKEAFKHSNRVGKSFLQTNEVLKYIKSYKKHLISILTIIVLIIIFGMSLSVGWKYLLFGIIVLFITFFEIQAFKRIKIEKEWRYIWSLPILSITRGLGYFYGMVKYLIFKN